MAPSDFHPVISRWFAERVGTPTPVQRRGWESIRAGSDTLIAAPTGSGKTLAAFLIALDDLLREALRQELPDEVRVVYVSPLKALSADIHKNLAEPRREIRRLAESQGIGLPHLTAAVRSGDTTPAERLAMLKTPPHILVTTPESLYLLLTAERSRAMLRSARTVIVDEIHSVLETRRGAHLALTLERLDHAAGRRLQRIGLSATQWPIQSVAQWLSGSGKSAVIIDEGHRRALDLDLELPGSPLQAVMSAEVWGEVYDRLTALIEQHRTTLVFVNTRRLAERVARQLADRLGEAAVTAHHGSLAKEARLSAEARLKGGELRALVATASLELGIDIGHVDLVCQLGSPRRIATLLQRVGRSGHTVRGTPKGRLFPLSRDELVECAALLRAVAKGELDRVTIQQRPLDVLAQQIVAESAAEPWSLDSLYGLCRRAMPYRELARERAGRWALIGGRRPELRDQGSDAPAVEDYARILLRRYGVVFHRLLARESIQLPWRELLLVYRRLEARGELRGGRFVAGVTGEQFALPEAVVSLRAVRREGPTEGLVSISAADPLNLIGIVTPGERVAALTGNRIVFENGVPLAVLESGEARWLGEFPPERKQAIAAALTRKPVSPKLRMYLGMSGRRPPEAAPRHRRDRV